MAGFSCFVMLLSAALVLKGVQCNNDQLLPVFDPEFWWLSAGELAGYQFIVSSDVLHP